MLQAVIDALSFELPKVLPKFASLSSRCLQLVDEIVDRFVGACNPRDMLSILCEVNNSVVKAVVNTITSLKLPFRTWFLVTLEDNKFL